MDRGFLENAIEYLSLHSGSCTWLIPLGEVCNPNLCDEFPSASGVDNLVFRIGYCQISCDRCDCCSTFKELATVNGLGEMIDLMEASGMDPEEYHANPAWMGTVLVPRPGAFANWLSAQGKTKQNNAKQK